jgi:hypothetical protein
VNGLGPAWFPASWRRWLTRRASFWFVSASWEKHDEGYKAGIKPRWYCDLRFYQEMHKDAGQLNAGWKIALASLLAFSFWALVRLFGWITYNRN